MISNTALHSFGGLRGHAHFVYWCALIRIVTPACLRWHRRRSMKLSQADSGSEFAFQDFHSEPGIFEEGQIEPSQTQDGHEEKPAQPRSTSSWLSFLTLEYYQGFFDVTTAQVAQQLLAGMVPLRYNLAEVIQPNPDLYGPIWLCMTLIFSTVISGNIVKVFEDQSSWEFHFHEVIVLGCALYIYTWLMPVVLSSLLWWRGSQNRYSLLELLSIYGYSISIFIPITMLWVINIDLLRWALLGIGTALSGAVLVLAVWKPFKSESKKLALVCLVTVFLMHAGLAVGFKFYYFSSTLAPQDSTLPTPAVSEHNSTSYSVHTARPSLAGYSPPTGGLSPVGHSAEYQVTNTFT